MDKDTLEMLKRIRELDDIRDKQLKLLGKMLNCQQQQLDCLEDSVIVNSAQIAVLITRYVPKEDMEQFNKEVEEAKSVLKNMTES